jgi:hypothetical protein
LFFNGGFGIGSRIPESPKTFLEKTSPRISATVLEEAPKRVNCNFQAIYKSKIERIPLNGLSRVAISALIIGTMWLGIYPTAELESACKRSAEGALQLGVSIKRVLASNRALSAGAFELLPLILGRWPQAVHDVTRRWR